MDRIITIPFVWLGDSISLSVSLSLLSEQRCFVGLSDIFDKFMEQEKARLQEQMALDKENEGIEPVRMSSS